MSPFPIRWIRRLLRRNTRPIPFDKAELWKRRLSITYMICAWNAFGIICYTIFTGKIDLAKQNGLKTGDEHLTPGQKYAKMLQIDNAKVIRYSGFKKVGEIEIIENNCKK